MKKFLVLLFALVLIFNVNAFAGNGGGNGDGGGESVPVLESATPADGDTDVDPAGEITLNFSNNIANASVRENNISAIQLLDASGAAVAMEVQIADDQIEPDKKRTAVIVPNEALAFDTTYTVVISPELTSKNGVQSGEEILISFTTASKPDAETTTLEETTAPETATDETIETTPAATEATSQEGSTNGSPSSLYIVIGIILIAGVAFFVIDRNKKK